MKKVKTNKLGRRILSFVLTVALMVGLMPGNILTVSAEGTDTVISDELIVESVSSNDASATTECTCGTDDPAFHATNCPAYIAPENPQCFCAEKCTEDTLNVWCDVCGMQGVSACQGTDTAVTYDAATPDFSAAKVLTAVNGTLYINDVAITDRTIPAGDYKLESDITTDIYVLTEGSINLDLNGHTWNMSDKYLRIDDNVTLSLYDTSGEGTGKITSSSLRTIFLIGTDSTFNLYSGTVENTSNSVSAHGVSSNYRGSSNLYGGTIKSNAYAVEYLLDGDITINIYNTSFDCGDGYAQFYTYLIANVEPRAVIDVSDYEGGALTVDAEIDTEIYTRGKIKIFTGIQSAQDAEKYKINFICYRYDFFKEKEEYNEETKEKYITVSVPSFTTQPTKENLYTVAFNHPDATLQWCEATVYDSATYSEEDADHEVVYEVNAGDVLIVSLSECSDDFFVNFNYSYNEETLYMDLDSSSKTASVSFDSEGTVNVEILCSPSGTGEYKIEHVRWTELNGENGVQLSKTECETTYVCKATVGEREYYSDEVTIEREHSYTCTATSDNVITKECANCGKVGGTLTINAEGGIYDGTTKYGATVEKTGMFENEEVTVNYYQGDTSIGTNAPVDAGTYTAKITYEGVTASVTYMISITPTAEMFTYIESAVYDGTKKSANVVVKDGITGIGAITNIKYYQNDIEVTPVNAGEYTVKIDVADGDIYDAATDIEVGTFEITKANTVITWNDQTLASTGEEAELTAPTLTFIGNDNPEVVLAYSYKAQGDAEYTTGLPTACGIYDVKVNVSATDNYNAVEDTMTLTITCTDADNNGICDHCGSYDEPVRVDGDYQIANAGNLMWFAEQVNEGQTTINAKLTADIDMKDIDWTMMSSFAGTFDGNGYTISGLNGHIDMWAQVQCHGFIRTLNNGGFVKNLTFTGAKVFNHEGSGAISAIIVYTNQGTVENCVVKDSNIHHGDYDALGVVVGVNGGTIRNCASISNTMTRRFSSTKDICGFVWSNSGSIETCFNYDCTYQNGSNRYAFTQSNTGTITNCYYYESSETISDTVVTAKTADQFAGGEVAYLLNGDQTTIVWGQTLTGENKQACPVLGGAKVYYGYTACNSTEKSYSNSEIGNEKPQHIFEEDSNGFCTVCGAYEQPETDEKGVYQISNAGELYWFAEYVNAGNTSANAKLTDNIVVNSDENISSYNGTDSVSWRQWTPIGNYLNKYTGTFEGNNKTISGLYFNDTTVEYVGLFGYIGSNAKIKNVGVVNSYFKGKDYVGGVCGYIGYSTIITNCYNKGSVSGGDSVGGVCGYNYNGTITNCYNKGSVSGGNYVGGVCGRNQSNGTITNCYNTGKVSGTGDYVGGVCSYNYISTITRCYYDNTVYTGNAVRKNVGGTVGADVLGKSTAEFNSGEVAYLLNGSSSENVTWYQTLETDTYPVLDSEHGIVYSVFKCDGTTPAGYSNENKNAHIDENGDEYCDDCGVIYNGIGAHLAGYSVSLNGSIGVNFHMDLTQDVLDDNEAYMLFTLPNGTTQKVMVSDAKAKESTVIEGKTYYIFTCNVAAKEMTDTIQAQLITSDGSKTQVYEYSVREYADRILSGNYDAETQELVKAMLHYGAYSQEWFDYNTTNLANAGLETLDLSEANDWDGFDPIITNDENVGSFTSAYLTLESDTAINLKFKLADGVSFEDLRVVVEDPLANVVPVTTVTTENVCLITLTGIKASDLDTTYDFSVTDGEGNESYISYSAMSYAWAVAKSEMDQKLKNVTAALRIFNLRANEKFEY